MCRGVVFPSEVVKIKYCNDEFMVDGNCLKQYYPNVPVPLYRHPKEDILVEMDPSQMILWMSHRLVGNGLFSFFYFYAFVLIFNS